jgi:sulfonate transport system permease protein
MTALAPAAAARGGRTPRELTARILPTVAIIAVWWLLAIVFASIRVVPTPWAVVEAFIGDLRVLPQNIGATLANAAIGYVVGNALALLTAVLFVTVRWTELVFMRMAVISFCIPLVALTPILVVLFPGDMPKQILAGLSVYFTTLVACLLGLRSVNASTVDVIRSMGGTGGTVLLKARLKAMLPSLFSGLQIAAPAAILGTILGEYMGASRGLGVLLVQSQSAFEVARTWSTALVMSALAGVVYVVAGWVGRRVTPWVSKEVTTAVGNQVTAASTIGKARNAGVVLLGFLGSLVVIVAAWWGSFTALGLDPYFAKTPADVWVYLVAEPTAAENRRTVLDGLAITLRDAGIGYAIGTVVACLAALLMVTSRMAERLLTPVSVVLRSVPLVAMAPLLALIFGRGLLGVTVIVSLVTFFPTLVNAASALRGAPALACDVVTSMGGSVTTVTRKVRLLYALPAVFASARIAVPGAIAGATLAEWLATGKGLGSMLVRDYAASRFSALWSETVVLLTVSVLLYAAISVVERQVAQRFAI